MTREEFYNQVSAWSLYRRQLAYVETRLEAVILKMQQSTDHNDNYSKKDIDEHDSLLAERKKLEFIVDGIVDTLDAEVDRVEKIISERPEMAQKLNRK